MFLPEFILLFHVLSSLISSIFVLNRSNYLRPNLAGWLLLVWVVPVFGMLLYLILFTRERNTNSFNFLTGINAGQLNNDNLEFLEDESFCDRVLVDIEQAKESVHIATYIFSGKMATKFLDTLKDATDRGVSATLLIDRLGSGLLTTTGRTMFMKHPLFKSKLFTIQYHHSRLIKSLLNFNRRLHSKIVSIDGQITYLGAHNIRDEAADKSLPAFTNNLSIRIEDPAIAVYYKEYVKYFPQRKPLNEGAREGKEEALPSVLSSCNVLASETWNDLYQYNVYKSLLHYISTASKRIYICTPYCVPPKSLRDLLNIKQRQGLDIKILIPSTVDSFAVESNHALVIKEFTDQNIPCYLSTTTDSAFDHSKFMIIDDVFSIGSFNLDYRSFFINDETLLYINDKLIAEKAISIFERKLTSAEQVTSCQSNKLKELLNKLISIPASLS